MSEPRLDKLGSELKIGSLVAAPGSTSRRTLSIGRITAITPKMVKVLDVHHTSTYHVKKGGTLYYASEVVCLDDHEQAFIYMLNRNND